MTIDIKYNSETFNLLESNSKLSISKINNKYTKSIKYSKYILKFTYNDLSIDLELSSSNILKLYVILQHHFKVKTIKDLSELEWDYTNFKVEITAKNNNKLSDHIKLLNYFLNLKNEFNTILKIEDLENRIKLKDKRGIGGERPRELNYMYGFSYYTPATKKSLNNSERLFESPFPIEEINPKRKAIVNVPNGKIKCFTCGCTEGEMDIFGKQCHFEKGHLIPIKVENTTKSYPQCKWCNTFYKDKIEWDFSTGKPKFNTLAVMRDTKKSDLISYIKKLGITPNDLEKK